MSPLSDQLGTTPNTWLVRCEGGDLFNDFVERHIVATGDAEPLPDMTGVRTREEIVDRLRANTSLKSIGYVAGVIQRLILEMQPGDRVLTYDPSQRVYAVGEVVGQWQYSTEKMEGKQYFRNVRWHESRLLRDDLSLATKRSLNSMVTVYRLSDDAAKEINALLHGVKPTTDAESESSAEADEVELRDLTSESRELVKDRIARLSWAQMQELVAGVLRAMGYKTRVSPPGADRGRDILASPDGLGLDHPRIIVEVKHRPSTAISGPDIRSFVGGMQASDRGLYVSTGGFTKDARYEADRSNTPVTLLDIDELVKLLLEHYEKADSRLRTLVPLVSVYWPAST